MRWNIRSLAFSLMTTTALLAVGISPTGHFGVAPAVAAGHGDPNGSSTDSAGGLGSAAAVGASGNSSAANTGSAADALESAHSAAGLGGGPRGAPRQGVIHNCNPATSAC